MATRLASLLALSGLVAGAAAAEGPPPLSAIDWLSNSVAEEAGVAPGAETEVPANPPPDIRVMSLDAPSLDATGLIDASELGVPADLWGRSSANDLAAALKAVALNTEAPRFWYRP